MNLSFLLGGIGRALSYRHYRHIWMGNAASHTGRWIQRTVILWLTWEMTESATWLGIVAFADLFPLAFVPMIAGVYTDRLGYISMLRTTTLMSTFVGAAFALLLAIDLLTIELIVVLTALIGTLEAIGSPARISIASNIVDRKDLSAALSLNTATFNVTRIIGPPLGAAIFSLTNAATALAVNAASFAIFYLLILTVPRSAGPPSDAQHRGFLKEFSEAFAYIIRDPGVRFILILLTSTALLIRPYIELVSGFVGSVFGGDVDTVGFLLSTTGLGAMISALYLARRGRTEGLTRIVTYAFAGTAITQFTFATTSNIWVGAVSIFFLGVTLLLGGVGSTNLVQHAVDQRLRARVMSIYISAGFGFPSIGALVIGIVADLGVGLQATVAGAAVTVAVIWVWAMTRWKAVAGSLEAAEPIAAPNR